MTLTSDSDSQTRPLHVGIGASAGSVKTALVEPLCKRLGDTHEIYVVTKEVQRKEIQDE